ncbi:glutathione S-transferase [Novimethylophilus kurashikiensis]|uniref:Glutathione S-transferase n=1 Tax=Novimethylophilus kurashikiensis TaxID=1825523 RepID=A0A2R5F8P6_9PROT|nr:glutathione S-transferase family protein [Novimethylophilus kurashikiensis]GBG13283.1 glutathione S-transferase [Novimethylophilus kurashikiensis]
MIKVYGFQNTRTTRVTWALEEAGAEYELIPVNLGKGEHRSPEFLHLSPGGKVPVLEDGDLVMTESAAICTYIGEKFPQSGLVPPFSQPIDRAHYFQWCFFAVSELEAAIWTLGKHQRFLPEERRVPEVAPTCLWEFHRHAAILAQHLKDREFVAGNQFTCADILMSGVLNWARNTGTNLESPALDAYADRMSARPALARARQREAEVTT